MRQGKRREPGKNPGGRAEIRTGDPAVVDDFVGRPVALRPHLSMGLPFFSEVSVYLSPVQFNTHLTEGGITCSALSRHCTSSS
jgi:hypothetical protein